MRSEILLLLGALALAGCDRQSDQTPQAVENIAAPVKVEDSGKLDIENRGQAMPDAVFQNPDGAKVSLGNFKGKPVLVNLWATWCVPCVAEMPTLDALAAREKDRLVVLAVSQDGSGKKVVDPWFAKNPLKMIQAYIDPEQALGDHFQTGMLPTTILYDAQGKEVWRMIGGMDWDGPRANTLLAETLGA